MGRARERVPTGGDESWSRPLSAEALRIDVELVVEPDAERAARAVAERLVATDGHIVLTGGETPRRAYELAAKLKPDWSDVEVWWGDERCVPPEDDRSNFKLAKEALLDRLELVPAVVHRIRGEIDPELAAREYEEAIGHTQFDLVLNGIGPDGHTASLFPNAPALGEREHVVVAAESKLEPFVERVTLTIPALARGRALIFLATGAEKAEAVRRAFGDPPSPATPSSLLRSALGPTTAVLDEAAAVQLSG